MGGAVGHQHSGLVTTLRRLERLPRVTVPVTAYYVPSTAEAPHLWAPLSSQHPDERQVRF